jgi:hypothetical protein
MSELAKNLSITALMLVVETLAAKELYDINRTTENFEFLCEKRGKLETYIAELEAAQRWHVVKECNNVATPIDVALRKRIAKLEAAQRWIPVSERLPEVGEEVFVCDESGHRRVDWLVCKPIDGVGETLFYSAAYDDDPPTHWMPLPKLPEVQE